MTREINMKNLAILSCLIGSVGLPAFAEPLVNSSVRAEVKDAIPGSTPKATKSIYYPEPAKINISAVQYCGDGDVAHYSQGRPQWVHKEASEMPFVLGYWVVPEGQSMPTADNFVALGTGNVPVGGSYISKFVPANKRYDDASKKKEMYAWAMASIKGLAALPSYSMKAGGGSSENYRMFLGAMMCFEPGGDITKVPVKNQGTYDLMPAMTSASFAKDVYNSIQAQADSIGNKSWSGIESHMQLSLGVKRDDSESSGGVKADMGSGPIDVRGDLARLAERVRQFDFPSLPAADPLTALKKALDDASFADDLRQLGSALDSADKCSDVRHGVSDREKYAWEPYPMQLTCKALNDGEKGKFSATVRAFLQPDSASENDFKEKRKAVVRLLVMGAQMQNAQAYVQNKINDGDNDWEMPKQRCFNGATPMIDYTMQSIVIQIPTVESAEYTPIHPEPDFAIGGSAPYSNDSHTVFGMTGTNPDTAALKLERGAPKVEPTYMPATMRLNMKVRGIGCASNVYCQNEYGPHAILKHL
jgi:hypothetical protein